MDIVQILLILVVSFIAGIEGILDEFEFHQPLVACSLLGLVSGHLEEGIVLGGALQLISLGWATVGAAVAPDVCYASVISSILMIKALGSSIHPAYVIAACIAIAIPLSLIGLSLNKIVRTQAIDLSHKMDETKDVAKYHIQGILMQGVRVALPVFIICLIPTSFFATIFNAIPEFLYQGLLIGSGIVCVVGFAIVSNVLSSKANWPFFIIGFALASLTNMPIIVLCLIGAGLMMLNMQSKQTVQSSTKSEDPIGDIIDDYE